VNNLDIFDYQLLNNPLVDWLVAAGIALAIVLAASMVKRLAVGRLYKLAGRTTTHLDDAAVALLERVQLWVIAILAIWAGSQFLNLPHKGTVFIGKATTLVVFLQIGLWCGQLLQFWVDRSHARTLASNPAATTTLGALVFVGRVLLWALILLLTLGNLGVNVSALVTSLGIGGIAIALAVQNVLGDLLASLSIVMDKPFVVGDFIVLDDYRGTVEHIGLKSTRLRSQNGEQIVLANSDLLKGRIRNYHRMSERRVEFTFRLAYATPLDKLEKVPAALRALVERHKGVRFERAHFKKLADTWLEFEVVYWVTNPDQQVFLDIQQAINLQLMAAFAKEKISFAGGSVVLTDKARDESRKPEKEPA
jgi:small-conductance mechanosensitive channel